LVYRLKYSLSPAISKKLSAFKIWSDEKFSTQSKVEFVMNVPPSSEDNFPDEFREGVKELLLENGRLRDERQQLNNERLSWQSHTRTYQGILAVLSFWILWWAMVNFQSSNMTVFLEENKVFMVQSKWWGFIQDYNEMQWMHSEEYGHEGWFVKDDKGEWNPIFAEWDGY